MFVASRASRISLAMIVVAGLLATLPAPTVWIEELYSRRLYLAAQNILTPLSGLATFAVFDVLLVGVPLALAVWWFKSIRGADRGARLRTVLTAGLHTVGLAAALYLVFLVVWGLNYRRQPLTAKIDYSQERVTAQALVELAMVTADRLNELHAPAHRVGWSSLKELPARLGGAFEDTQRQLGSRRAAVTGDPKTTLLTPYFRRAGIDGMISPFSLEILVNDSVLPFERPYVVAHEWAHLAGYADESEASFVGWLTCVAGDDSTRYSAWLSLAPRVMRHMGDDERRQFWGRLGEGPTNDLQAVAERLRDAVPIVQRSANRVYDQYLKANRVEAGIASYGAVVDLILGTGVWRE